MGKTLNFIFIVICAVALAGCNEGTDPKDVNAIPIIVVNESTYRAYARILYDSLAVIDEIDGEINGDILHLIVTFLGGCEEQQFEMVAARFINYSLPAQGHTLLVNSGPADSCQVETRTALAFDLTPYREYLQSSGLVKYGPITVGINRGLFSFSYHY